MKKIYKKMILAFLSVSNLAVLGLVFQAYLGNQQKLYLFSRSESVRDLRKKVEKECQKALQELVEGQRSSFICNVKVQQRQRGASHSLRTKVTVSREADGSFSIEGQGAMREKKGHATEADFCNDCSTTKNTVANEGDLTEIMKQVLDTAEKFYDEAHESVQEARKASKQKSQSKNKAEAREQKCEGHWDSANQTFEEFDREERLKCKMNRISELSTMMDIDRFYHGRKHNFQKELWNIAISDEDYLLEDTDVLERLASNPYRHSLTVRNSAILLRHYLKWKDHFEVLDSVEDKNRFLRGIKDSVDQKAVFMNANTRNLYQRDMYYLNKGFDGLLVDLNQVSPRIPSSPGTAPPINYEEVRRQVEDLYKK